MPVLRALRQLTFASCRIAARPVLPSGLVAEHVWYTAPSLSATRGFSTTPSRFSAADVSFSQSLAAELELEKEPDFLKSFRAEGVWTIKDIEGIGMVNLTRTFGNENICLVFSIVDIRNLLALTKLNHAEGRQEDVESHLIRTVFDITKDGVEGSLTVNTICQGGAFNIFNIPYFLDGTDVVKVGWEQRRFVSLDMSVQEEFEKWLNERGVNESLAAFIPEYVEYKEQKEYVRWLENVKNFIEV